MDMLEQVRMTCSMNSTNNVHTYSQSEKVHEECKKKKENEKRKKLTGTENHRIQGSKNTRIQGFEISII